MSKLLVAKDNHHWAKAKIGHPFPDNPFRVKGQTNRFVALCYKDGKPICGRAWNNGGVLECSFPYGKKELSGPNLRYLRYDTNCFGRRKGASYKDLGGEIEILVDGNCFYFRNCLYNWVAYNERDGDYYQLVFCGDVCPALVRTNDGVLRAGQIDVKTEIASASYDNQAEQITGKAVRDMLVVVRNLKEPPKPKPGPPLPKFLAPCPHESGNLPPLGNDGWVDLRVTDHKILPRAVLAMGRPLNLEDGSEQAQAVALWYKLGEPVMGRAYDSGNLAATFGWKGKQGVLRERGIHPGPVLPLQGRAGVRDQLVPLQGPKVGGLGSRARQGLRPLRHHYTFRGGAVRNGPHQSKKGLRCLGKERTFLYRTGSG